MKVHRLDGDSNPDRRGAEENKLKNIDINQLFLCTGGKSCFVMIKQSERHNDHISQNTWMKS